MPRTPINLDELVALNPEPQVYLVGGRELVLRELSHVQFFQAEEFADRIQKGIAAGKFRPGELLVETNRLLMHLYEPHNRWLVAEDDQAHATAVKQWRKRHPDGKAPAEGEEPDPIPVRHDFCGTWFESLSHAKIVHLSTEAFKFNQQSVVDAQADGLVDLPTGVNESDLPPVLAAARQAAMDRRSNGARSTSS